MRKIFAKSSDLLHMLENTFDRKCISANHSPNPKVRFWYDEMTSFFEQV